MKDYKKAIGFGLAAMAFGSIVSGCGKASAQVAKHGSDGGRNVNLTIYKEDFAEVSEQRPVELQSGHTRFAVEQVSKQLDPNSVLFNWPDSSSQAEVVATTYDMGVGDGSKLLSRLNGQQVEMVWPSENGKQGDTVGGRLEAAEQGNGFALRTADKLYINPPGTIVAPAAAAASTLPQLSLEVDSSHAGPSKLGVSYLTRGLSWSADYVAKLDPSADKADLECWASIKNETGIPFPEAKLTLMAGSPNRAVVTGTRMTADIGRMSRDDVTLAAPNGMMRAKMPMEAVGEIYAYKVPSTATIGDDQMNRVSMLGTRSVPIKRDYAIRLPQVSAWGYDFDGQPPAARCQATLSISFVNDDASDLGMPLPAGTVRVYDMATKGDPKFIGASSIGDTAKKEHVDMTISNVFDVYGQYRVVKSQKVDKHTVRKTIEIVLHNEKSRQTDVRVVESFSGAWEPVQETEPSRKLDSSTVQWTLPVAAGSEKALTFTVDLRV